MTRAPAHIRRAANAILSLYHHHELRARRTKKRRYLSLAVGNHWRLLSRDNGISWRLMSHSAYNNYIDR